MSRGSRLIGRRKRGRAKASTRVSRGSLSSNETKEGTYGRPVHHLVSSSVGRDLPGLPGVEESELPSRSEKKSNDDEGNDGWEWKKGAKGSEWRPRSEK